MIPLDLSITNLILMAAVAFLAALYVIILLKLKPSAEKKDQHRKDVHPKSWAPPENGAISINSLKTNEKIAVPQMSLNQIQSQKMQPSVIKATSLSTSQDEGQGAPEHVVIAETRTSNVHCVHHFGYLTELPRNTAIPTECLGCSKAVECMTTLSPEKKQVKSHVTQG